MPDSPRQMPLSLTAHNNQSLFSDHYLDDILFRSPAWQTAVSHARPFLTWLRALYEQEKEQLASYKESQLEENWFKPIFARLGHVWEVQAAIPGSQAASKSLTTSSSPTKQPGKRPFPSKTPPSTPKTPSPSAK